MARRRGAGKCSSCDGSSAVRQLTGRGCSTRQLDLIPHVCGIYRWYIYQGIEKLPSYSPGFGPELFLEIRESSTPIYRILEASESKTVLRNKACYKACSRIKCDVGGTNFAHMHTPKYNPKRTQSSNSQCQSLLERQEHTTWHLYNLIGECDWCHPSPAKYETNQTKPNVWFWWWVDVWFGLVLCCECLVWFGFGMFGLVWFQKCLVWFCIISMMYGLVWFGF